MSVIALSLTIMLAVATVSFYVAGGLYAHGSPWARDVCGLSQQLCANPGWAAIATGVIALVYYGLRSYRF
jgi:hypothetical protein